MDMDGTVVIVVTASGVVIHGWHAPERLYWKWRAGSSSKKGPMP